VLTNKVCAAAKISVAVYLLVSIGLATVIHDSVRYEQPVRAIRGKVTSLSHVIPAVWVDVYDNAQVCLDDSMPPSKKEKDKPKSVLWNPMPMASSTLSTCERDSMKLSSGSSRACRTSQAFFGKGFAA